jgi:hypothetical protein
VTAFGLAYRSIVSPSDKQVIIDLEHRLIYRVQNESIQFLQARYHYES